MSRLLHLVAGLLAWRRRPSLPHVERIGFHISAASAPAARRAPLSFVQR